MQSIGDLAHVLTQRAHHARIKNDINQMGEELTTGLRADPARDLAGDLMAITGLETTLSRIQGYRLINTETGLVADTMQNALGDLQTLTGQLGVDYLKVDLSSSAEGRQALGSTAEQVFATVVGRLNTSQAGRSLFGGVATDRASLAPATQMVNDIKASLSGAVSATDVIVGLDAWFDMPGGGFDTDGYLGSSATLAPVALNDTETVQFELRADNVVLRDLLKFTVMGQLAVDPDLGLGSEAQTTLMARAGNGLVNVQTGLTGLRADLGSLQERIANAAERNDLARDQSQIARNDILAIDRFETATRLEQTQTQLETLYAIAGRERSLSLVDYLR